MTQETTEITLYTIDTVETLHAYAYRLHRAPMQALSALDQPAGRGSVLRSLLHRVRRSR